MKGRLEVAAWVGICVASWIVALPVIALAVALDRIEGRSR